MGARLSMPAAPRRAAHAHRRTFADAVVASAHSMLPSLRHRGFARPATPAPWHGQPLAHRAI